MMFLLLLACGMGLPLPEDITLISAGYIAYLGTIDPLIATVIGLFGVLIGDSFIYFLGYKFGMRIFTVPVLRRLFTQRRIKKAQNLLARHDNKFLFVTRFLAGLRAPIFFTCGSLGVPFRKFLFWDGLAAMVSVPLLIFAAFWGGSYIDGVVKMVKKVEYGILIVAMLLISFFVIRYYYYKKKNGNSGNVDKIADPNDKCCETN
ncbi:MAG: DedA family protein [Oligoflexia bacterium]|nr:DedA family protein [Oligoflexia bacterium]